MGRPLAPEAQSGEQVLATTPFLSRGRAAQSEGDVVDHRTPGQQPWILEHHGHPVGPTDRATSERDEPDDGPQQGRLAHPGRAGDRHQLARTHEKIDPVQNAVSTQVDTDLLGPDQLRTGRTRTTHPTRPVTVT